MKFFTVPTADIKAKHVALNLCSTPEAQLRDAMEPERAAATYSSLAAMVAYVGSREYTSPSVSMKLISLSPPRPLMGICGPKWMPLEISFHRYVMPPTPMVLRIRSSCAPPNTINPNFGSVRGMFYEGRSYYKRT